MRICTRKRCSMLQSCNDAKKAMSLDKFLAWIARLTAYQSQFQGKKS